LVFDNLQVILIEFVVLLVSLTVHEAAHAWSADILGDPTARSLGRVSLNPVVHVDPVGTLLFPLIALMTNIPVLGWAKPVPVNTANLHGHWKRKYMMIAAAGPASNLALAVRECDWHPSDRFSGWLDAGGLGDLSVSVRAAGHQRASCGLQHDPGAAARWGQCLVRAAARTSGAVVRAPSSVRDVRSVRAAPERPVVANHRSRAVRDPPGAPVFMTVDLFVAFVLT
jgi:hypothetical protein